MSRSRITVQCYAGSRADECPRRITIQGREHFLTRLVSESVEESAEARERIHRYKVVTDAGIIFEILRKNDGWYLDAEPPAVSTDLVPGAESELKT